MSLSDHLDLKAWLQFAREGAASLGLRIVALVSTLALGVLLARLLGPAEYGRYGLVMSLAFLGAAIAQLGTTQLAVRELSVRLVTDVGSVRPIVLLFVRITIVASSGIGLVALGASIILKTDAQLVGLVSLGILVMAGTALISVASAELRGLGNLSQGQFFETVGRPLLTLATVGIALLAGLSLTASMAIAIQVFAAAISLLVTMIWLFRAIPRRNQSANLNNFRWLGAALPLGLVDILRTLDGSYGLILMAPLTSDVELGIYRVAVSCLALIAMPTTICHIVFAPQLARLSQGGERGELARFLARVSGILTACMIPATALIYLYGKAVIVFAFGDQYAQAWQPLFILACAHTLLSFFGMGPIMLAMSNGEKALIRIYATSVTLGVVSAVPLIRAFGANGAALAQLISLGTIGVLCWRSVRRGWRVDLTILSRGRPI